MIVAISIKTRNNIRERIALPSSPFYGIRRQGDLAAQLKRRSAIQGEPAVTGFQFRTYQPKTVQNLNRQYQEAKATALNVSDALKESTRAEGGDAATLLMQSSIEFLFEQQKQMDRLIGEIRAEGYDPAQVDRSIPALFKRTFDTGSLPTKFQELIKWNVQKQIHVKLKLIRLVLLTVYLRLQMQMWNNQRTIYHFKI